MILHVQEKFNSCYYSSTGFANKMGTQDLCDISYEYETKLYG